MIHSEQEFIQHVRKRLNTFKQGEDPPFDAKPAAVLLPLFWDQGEWHLLYTRRTDSLESHRGQVAFPGGAVEAQDASPEQTALREAFEEIGIKSNDVEVLGSFNKMLTISLFHVTPIVGRIPWPYDLKINHEEVATTFGPPLSWLVDPANLSTETRFIEQFKLNVPVNFFKPYDDEVIWGATAAITLNFLDLIGLRDLK
jgi:8-oxo-dGTP pyrophosphatase MutT (NUDIX family)